MLTALTTQLSLFNDDELVQLTTSYQDSIMAVTNKMVGVLRSRKRLTHTTIKRWMNGAFGGSDAQGKWLWKDVYDAQEAAYIRLLLDSKPPLSLASLSRISTLGLTHTRRTDESIRLQQFSTPLELGYLVAACAQITCEDIVLEPSAGTGLMAVFAELAGAKLILNEMSDRRSGILHKLFPSAD